MKYCKHCAHPWNDSLANELVGHCGLDQDYTFDEGPWRIIVHPDSEGIPHLVAVERCPECFTANYVIKFIDRLGKLEARIKAIEANLAAETKE